MKRRYTYDYSRLKGKLREKAIVYRTFAEMLGLSESSVSERLNNNAQFTQEEIEQTLLLLGIPLREVEYYFFTHEVQKS